MRFPFICDTRRRLFFAVAPLTSVTSGLQLLQPPPLFLSSQALLLCFDGKVDGFKAGSSCSNCRNGVLVTPSPRVLAAPLLYPTPPHLNQAAIALTRKAVEELDYSTFMLSHTTDDGSGVDADYGARRAVNVPPQIPTVLGPLLRTKSRRWNSLILDLV